MSFWYYFGAFFGTLYGLAFILAANIFWVLIIGCLVWLIIAAVQERRSG